VYVHSQLGSDSGSGSAADPFRTLETALEACRRTPNLRHVVLREGVHHLQSTLQVDVEGLTLTNHPGEEAWISGGQPLSPVWEPAGKAGNLTIYRAHLPQTPRVLGLNRLQYEDPLHARMTRARHPNKDVVADGTMERQLLSGEHSTWLKPPGWGEEGFNLSRSVYLAHPASDEAAGGGGTHFTYGVGGWSCARYRPEVRHC
jgi:hypothetical protein